MATGVVRSKTGSVLGGVFASGSDGAPRLRSVIRSLDGLKAAHASIGVDWESLSVESLRTPETDEAKLLETARLQREYRQASSSWFNFIVERGEKGSEMLLLSAPSFALPPKAQVYPLPAALYALAFREGLAKPGANVLTVFLSEGSALSVFSVGESIAFARSFPKDGRIGTNLKLSCQSVFFAKERRFLRPDGVLVVSDDPLDAKLADSLWGKGVQTRHLDFSKLFQSHELSFSERASMALAYGLSLAPGTPGLSQWNLLGTRESSWRRHRGLLSRCAALLLLLPPLVYGAEYLSDGVLLARLEKESASMAPLYARVSGLVSDIESMKAFASRSGRDLVGPESSFEVLSEIERARGDGLFLSSFSGSPYGVFSLSGRAPDYQSLLDFIGRLSKSEALGGAELVFANLSEGGGVEFQATAKSKLPKEFRGAKPLTEEGSR